MPVSLSPNLPANVVEIGNEISQAKIDEINAGTLALQTWVSASYLTTASASSTYAPKASPTFTGTVTIPAGASISGYLTTATASSTYQTQAGMSSYLTTATASSTYQTQAGMSSYLTTSAASTTYAPKASPTFTGTVTIPAGASISGYLTTSSASSTYQTISGMSSYLTASTAASTYQPIGSYLTDAPSNGNEYVRKNGAWAIATGGSGGVAWGAITGTVTDQTDLTSYISGLGYITSAGLSVTNIDLTGNFNGYSMGSGYYTFKFDSTANTLRMQDGAGSGITISPTGITFPNSSVLTSSPSKSVNAITGAYTLALSDANNIIYADSSAGGGMSYYLTVPDDGTTNFPVGTVISLVANAGSGATIDITTTLMGTPTIYGTTSFAGGQVHQAFLTKVAADTWIIK
jgi:hypothetical protein